MRQVQAVGLSLGMRTSAEGARRAVLAIFREESHARLGGKSGLQLNDSFGRGARHAASDPAFYGALEATLAPALRQLGYSAGYDG